MDHLVGVWCVGEFLENYEGPGEWFLTFREDRTGRYDDVNYGMYYSTTFRWDLLSNQHIRISGIQSFAFSRMDPIHDVEDASSVFYDVPFRVRTEITPSGRSISVFRST